MTAAIEHLGDALQNLELEADTLWAPRKAGSRLYYQARDDFEAAGKDLKQHLLRAKDWQAQHEAVRARAPLQRSATPDDCVEAVLGLLRSRYATGHVFVVDGGLTLTM